ncbi:MAG: hypothetical protein WKF31_01285 [Thermoleophilaceae bacterium]
MAEDAGEVQAGSTDEPVLGPTGWLVRVADRHRGGELAGER